MVQVSAAGSRDDPKSIAQSYGNAIGAEAFRVRPSFEAAARAAAPQDEAILSGRGLFCCNKRPSS
jgi:hypothetical protein